MKVIDITGKRFGHLVVIKRVENYRSPKGSTAVSWLCQCDCGNTRVYRSNDIRKGIVRHCGCMKWSHKFNDIREDGETLFIKVKDKEVIIDKEDLDKLYPYRVTLDGNGYAHSKKRLVHRLVMDCPKGYEVDHINHNPLDNRKCNLRVVTRSENNINRIAKANTGEWGITRRKDGWFMVTVDNKYRGIRKNLEDAITLRNESLKGTRQAELNYYLKEGVTN